MAKTSAKVCPSDVADICPKSLRRKIRKSPVITAEAIEAINRMIRILLLRLIDSIPLLIGN
jgi:hypothetical protein